jgi:hypothetical protein
VATGLIRMFRNLGQQRSAQVLFGRDLAGKVVLTRVMDAALRGGPLFYHSVSPLWPNMAGDTGNLEGVNGAEDCQLCCENLQVSKIVRGKRIYFRRI